jgi:hypothetical protein
MTKKANTYSYIRNIKRKNRRKYFTGENLPAVGRD